MNWYGSTVKLEIFQSLDNLTPPDTILATNTSTIPISRIAKVAKLPGIVLGLHFFGPVSLMHLAEVIKSDSTSADVFDKNFKFIYSLGMTPIRIQKDVPGFAVNRLLFAAALEALDFVDQGVANPDDIDIGMKIGMGWSAGLFEIIDNGGHFS